MSNINPIFPLPLPAMGFTEVPAIPVVPDQWGDTLKHLYKRSMEIKSAQDGLSNIYTIQRQEYIAKCFLFDCSNNGASLSSIEPIVTASSEAVPENYGTESSGQQAAPPVSETITALTNLSLDDPKQFSLSWTTYQDVYKNALPYLDKWAGTLTDGTLATEEFWSLLSEYALAFNLLVVQKITPTQLIESRFGFDDLPASLTELATIGQLYAIDLSLFTCLNSVQVGDTERFTPASFTFLQHHPSTKALLPIGIWVAGMDGAGKQIYWHDTATESAWLYALQAVKTSLTVYGIWLGHVYQWHIVTGAMQMTMYNTFSEQHPIYQLLRPQSDYLMAFNNVLMFLWPSIAPPTSLTTPYQFLALINQYASQRSYFDDDPLTTLERQGIKSEDFTSKNPWDQYLVVGQFMQIWEATKQFVRTFVLTTYTDDAAVARDQELQNWLSSASDPYVGNVAGIEPVQNQTDLIALLTSLVYRVTIHGVSRLIPSANPSLTFVANYPPCLQKSTIPTPDSHFCTEELLAYLPNTGTIGDMVNFYFTFSFSKPYVPFLPIEGIESNLFFSGGLNDPRNQALVLFRAAIQQFITTYTCEDTAQFQQWPINIET